jgi:hypothetical protein
MIIKRFILIILFSNLIFSCAGYNARNNNITKNYHSSKGFALIYDKNLYINKTLSKKLDQEKVRIFHRDLKKNTHIKIINPENNISLSTIVHANTDFPKIFNAVISEKVSSILKLDKNNPYIEILETKKNKTFVAKEGNIFDEEKNVAEKAPVGVVKVDDLSTSTAVEIKKTKKVKNFTITISDFYYKDSAISLMNELIKKTKYKSFFVKEINKNKYRLLVGPFKNFNALKNVYISLNTLGFENLNIVNE